MDGTKASQFRKKPLKLACVIFGLLALFWMALPMVSEFSATEMGFTPGDPDPNHYSDEYFFGAPLTWITWKHGWSVGLGYDEQGFEQFQVGNFVLHLLIIAVPITFAFWPTKMRTQSS